jgi:hypothetical protein
MNTSVKSSQLVAFASDALTPKEEAVFHAQQSNTCRVPKPFYLVRLRNNMLSMARQFFSSQHLYDFAQEDKDMPKVPSCLLYSPDAAVRKLEVEPLFSAQPPEVEKPAVYVGLSDAKFSRMALDNSTVLVSKTQHISTHARKCEVNVLFTAQHPEGDMATLLLELLQTHLEGSRLMWMRELGLLTMDTVSISPVTTAGQDARRILRSTLTCAVTAEFQISTTEQSLPLREVHISSTAGS